MSLGMPVTVEERDAEGSGRGPTENNLSTRMYYYGRELCFILALIFTSFAALQNAPPKISRSPAPVPFFPSTSIVADFYYGQLNAAFERVAESDVSFVMYYAPWDSESQITKQQFKSAAQYYYKQVYFAAINCWQPLSECRLQFSKIQHFPVLIAYPQHTKGIQYKGIKEAAHMIRFLQSVLRPLERVERPADLANLLAHHDAVVVGFLNFSGNVGGAGFHTFYTAALKFLEKDPYREVCFAVVTNEQAADELGVSHLPTVRLYMWNETVEYNQESGLSVEILTKWVSLNIHQVTVWVTPPGVKSLTLSPYVEEGSVMMLFTPRNPLLHFNNYYDLFREVGLEYYNCNDSPWVNDLLYFVANNRIETTRKHKELEMRCSVWREQRKCSSPPPVQVVRSRWVNESSCQTSRTPHKLCPPLSQGDKTTDATPVPRSSGCEELLLPPDDLQSCSSTSRLFQAPHNFCGSVEGSSCGDLQQPLLSTSMLTGNGDDRAASALIAASFKENCRLLRRAQALHGALFAGLEYHRKAPLAFRGLACRSNKTLSLLALDSLQFQQFAEGLGIDILDYTDKTTAIIFNAALESTYALDREITKSVLLDFIMNYTEGTLNRSFRSTTNELRFALNQYSELEVKSCKNTSSTVCVPELNSKNFLQFVTNPKQAVVVLYHSPYCAFCHAVSHHFLTVARYFQTLQKLSFARIDGENNDLPWEFTMHHYPTILFFPAARKSESRVFPQHLPLTVPNLVNFVMGNIGPGVHHLEGMIALCVGWEQSQDSLAAKDCLVRVRSESLEMISNMLLQYRTANFKLMTFYSNRQLRRLLHKHRKALLFRLQILKEVNLLLGSVHRLKEDSSAYKAIQMNLEKYRKFIRESSDVLFVTKPQSFSKGKTKS